MNLCKVDDLVDDYYLLSLDTCFSKPWRRKERENFYVTKSRPVPISDGKIGNKEYRQITGLGKVFTAKELNELVKKKIFVKVGKGSATHYVLSERSVND